MLFLRLLGLVSRSEFEPIVEIDYFLYLFGAEVRRFWDDYRTLGVEVYTLHSTIVLAISVKN